MAPYPDVAPFAGSSFDCCDLLQRNVIYHGTGKASGISSWCASSIVRLQTIGLKRWSSAFGALGPIRRRENDQKFAYEKIICARRRPNRSVFDGGRCDFDLCRRKDGKVRGSPSWLSCPLQVVNFIQTLVG